MAPLPLEKFQWKCVHRKALGRLSTLKHYVTMWLLCQWLYCRFSFVGPTDSWDWMGVGLRHFRTWSRMSGAKRGKEILWEKRLDVPRSLDHCGMVNFLLLSFPLFALSLVSGQIYKCQRSCDFNRTADARAGASDAIFASLFESSRQSCCLALCKHAGWKMEGGAFDRTSSIPWHISKLLEQCHRSMLTKSRMMPESMQSVACNRATGQPLFISFLSLATWTHVDSLVSKKYCCGCATRL